MDHFNLQRALNNTFLTGISNADLETLCSETIGIHAARVQTPYITVLSRAPHIAYHDLYDALNVTNKLIKIRCMRNTLHICNLDDAKYYHYATLDFRRRRCELEASKYPGFDSQRERLRERVLSRLASLNMSERELEEALRIDGELKDRRDLMHHRLTLKMLWEEGIVCLQDRSREWNKEARVFGITSRIYGDDIFAAVERKTALRHLIRRYFGCFGPASIRDFCWWSGIGVREAFGIVNDEVAEEFIVSREINGVPMFVLAEDDTSESPRYDVDEEVRLLAWEDLYLKGYFETRWRYVEKGFQKRAFNSIGEARRTIMFRGKLIGIWDVDDTGMPVEYEIFERDKVIEKKVEDAIHQLALRLTG